MIIVVVMLIMLIVIIIIIIVAITMLIILSDRAALSVAEGCSYVIICRARSSNSQIVPRRVWGHFLKPCFVYAWQVNGFKGAYKHHGRQRVPGPPTCHYGPKYPRAQHSVALYDKTTVAPAISFVTCSPFSEQAWSLCASWGPSGLPFLGFPRPLWASLASLGSPFWVSLGPFGLLWASFGLPWGQLLGHCTAFAPAMLIVRK